MRYYLPVHPEAFYESVDPLAEELRVLEVRWAAHCWLDKPEFRRMCRLQGWAQDEFGDWRGLPTSWDVYRLHS